MKKFNGVAVLILMAFSSAAWSYGGGGAGGVKSCTKPKFTDFTPAENAQVPAGADFSFVASSNTYPNTIKVTVKEQPIDITVAEKSPIGFPVSGKLPPALKGVYARIAITADAQSDCKGTGGWLVKISD